MRSIRGGGPRVAGFATLLAVTLAALTPARAAFWDAPVKRAPVVTPLPQVAPVAPAPALAPRAAAPTPLIYAISDLHIGEGVRDDGKMSPLEDFTVDAEFEDFIDHAIGQRDARGADRAKLVLHGDVFDFLKIITPPKGAKFAGSQKARDAADVAADERLAVLKMRRIVEAHPRVLRGLRTWMAAGNDLVIVAGNHDQELFYGRVRQVLRAALGPEQKNLKFEPYLHLDGDVLIEHGQRYDPMNAVSHMLYPFSSMDADKRRLRPSVGNFVVVQLNNRFKEKVPELNYLSRGRAMMMAILRRAPKDLLAVVPFALRIAGLTGNKAPTHASRAIAQEHVRRLTTGPWIEEQRRTINATRAQRGQAPLSTADMRRLMLRWDGLSAKPYLETMNLGKNRFAGMLRLLRPREFKKWIDATFGNTAPGALELAFSEMVNVHVQGHTHVAGIEDATVKKSWGREEKRGDGRRRWVVNTGAWIPHMEHGHPDARSFLTFLEVSREGGETTPRLLRWDTKTRSMVAANGGSQPEERGRASRPGRIAPVMGPEAARRNAQSPTRVMARASRVARQR